MTGSVIVVDLPAVGAAGRPEDHAAVGPELDRRCAEIVQDVTPAVRTIGIRGLSMTDHPGRSAAELADVIIRTGTDRYDPGRRLAFTEFYDSLGVQRTPSRP